MAVALQVLFIQGGGKGTHDEWDNQLVESLTQELGPAFEVHYPRMPNEAEPSYSSWKSAIQRAVDTLPEGAFLVAHSVGGTILLKFLTEHELPRKPAGIFLLAAPFVGDGGWSTEDLEFPPAWGASLPQGVPIDFYHGLADDTAPPAHVELYARAVPASSIHRLPGRDHQLNNDLSEVAAAISARTTSGSR